LYHFAVLNQQGTVIDNFRGGYIDLGIGECRVIVVLLCLYTVIFWKKYENPMEPIFKSVFNTFLKVNNQKDGIKSYNAVVGLIINHRKQHFQQD
jgi:hypothetical protein